MIQARARNRNLILEPMFTERRILHPDEKTASGICTYARVLDRSPFHAATIDQGDILVMSTYIERQVNFEACDFMGIVLGYPKVPIVWIIDGAYSPSMGIFGKIPFSDAHPDLDADTLNQWSYKDVRRSLVLFQDFMLLKPVEDVEASKKVTEDWVRGETKRLYADRRFQNMPKGARDAHIKKHLKSAKMTVTRPEGYVRYSNSEVYANNDHLLLGPVSKNSVKIFGEHFYAVSESEDIIGQVVAVS